ncbi:hypothetical protein NPIL_399031 [Nephila pilipes]|uniref:Uncharacterized protein n=1 Tax=Nephila pilipes TaxID=299642 RepID=A0A8X6R2P4_NEPPI|nr:hypothetical protein NPIL_399031 [Nephila pilipes]
MHFRTVEAQSCLFACQSRGGTKCFLFEQRAYSLIKTCFQRLTTKGKKKRSEQSIKFPSVHPRPSYYGLSSLPGRSKRKQLLLVNDTIEEGHRNRAYLLVIAFLVTRAR